jgi:hypothetical protein
MQNWQKQILEITKNQANNLIMKTYKINFLDIEDNTIYTKIDTYFDEQDATKYDKTILATTSDECVNFEIYEI